MKSGTLVVENGGKKFSYKWQQVANLLQMNDVEGCTGVTDFDSLSSVLLQWLAANPSENVQTIYNPGYSIVVVLVPRPK